jgi:hypothetical protein
VRAVEAMASGCGRGDVGIAGINMKAIIVFRACDSQTPLARLRTRRRWVEGIITVCLVSGVWMMEAFACFFLFGASIIELVLLLASTVVCMLTILPAVFLIPLAGEIEHELAARGALPEAYVSVENRMGRYFRRGLFFAVVTGVAIAVLH